MSFLRFYWHGPSKLTFAPRRESFACAVPHGATASRVMVRVGNVERNVNFLIPITSRDWHAVLNAKKIMMMSIISTVAFVGNDDHPRHQSSSIVIELFSSCRLLVLMAFRGR